MLIRIFVFWGRLIRNYTFWGWLIQGGFFPVAFLLCINSTNLLNKLTKPSSVAAVDHLHRTQWQLTPMTSSNSRSQKQWQWQWRLTPTATTPPLAGSLSRFKPQSIAAVSAVIPNLGKGYIAFHCTQPMEFKCNDRLPSIAIYQAGSSISPANIKSWGWSAVSSEAKYAMLWKVRGNEDSR